jgi:hypothetical protein
MKIQTTTTTNTRARGMSRNIMSIEYRGEWLGERGKVKEFHV